MKKAINSLLGIEMSLGGYEIKPFLLLSGLLLFIVMSIPLMCLYCFVYIKFTLVNTYKEINKDCKFNKNSGLKGV
jgi:hypothetical protein